LEKEFPLTFSGIEVKLTAVEPAELTTKLITEKRAGGVRADLVMGSLRDVIDLLERGMVSTQDYASLGIPKDLILFDGRLVGIWNVVFAHVYNTNLIKDPTELPKAWDDFLETKWKGKLAAWNFLRWLTRPMAVVCATACCSSGRASRRHPPGRTPPPSPRLI
jgi:ABC-type Fe3+ transport system substrate-binding protein